MKIKDIKEIEVMASKGLESLKPAKIRFTVGNAGCGLSKGARETLEALKQEVAQSKLDAEVVAVGCIGLLLCGADREM